MAANNRKNPTSKTASWTADKICGKRQFRCRQKTIRALPWCPCPDGTGGPGSLARNIIQGPQESYAQFVARLQEAAERILGPEESEGLLVQQLALENANSACRAALRGKTKSLDINGMIKLCNEVDVFSQQVSKSINLAIGAAVTPAPRLVPSPIGPS